VLEQNFSRRTVIAGMVVSYGLSSELSSFMLTSLLSDGTKSPRMVRIVRRTKGTKNPRMVRKIHGTKRPRYEKSTYGTKRLWYEKCRFPLWMTDDYQLISLLSLLASLLTVH